MRTSDRRQYAREQRQFITMLEKVWQPRIYNALLGQIRPAIAFMKSQGTGLALAQLEVIVPDEPIRSVLTRLYRAVFPRSANREAGRIRVVYGKELRQEKAFGTPDAYWLRLVQEFMLTGGATKVTNISETTREFIRKVINNGLAKGDSIEQIAKALISSPINTNRARLIARTELTNVTNMGGQAAARRSGLLMQKVWISTQDNRTRRTPPDRFDHLEMDNKVAMMNEPFNVSGELMQHPGDPAASAGNVCFCRCTCANEAVRDENNRLIRVPVPAVSGIYVQRPARPQENITRVVTV